MLLDTKSLPQEPDNRSKLLVRRELEDALIQMWS